MGGGGGAARLRVFCVRIINTHTRARGRARLTVRLAETARRVVCCCADFLMNNERRVRERERERKNAAHKTSHSARLLNLSSRSFTSHAAQQANITTSSAPPDCQSLSEPLRVGVGEVGGWGELGAGVLKCFYGFSGTGILVATSPPDILLTCFLEANYINVILVAGKGKKKIGKYDHLQSDPRNKKNLQWLGYKRVFCPLLLLLSRSLSLSHTQTRNTFPCLFGQEGNKRL